jgi:predicted amidophosphoribosyltransferase
MGKDDAIAGALVGLLALGLIAVGLSGFFAKPKCPACKAVLQDKPSVCPYCRTPLRWNT